MATDKGFFNYCVATNTGKGFITHTDSRKFWISGQPGNVWICDPIFIFSVIILCGFVAQGQTAKELVPSI